MTVHMKHQSLNDFKIGPNHLLILESRINVGQRLLILCLFSRGYVLIKDATFINFPTFYFLSGFLKLFFLLVCIKNSNFLLNVPGQRLFQNQMSISKFECTAKLKFGKLGSAEETPLK